MRVCSHCKKPIASTEDWLHRSIWHPDGSEERVWTIHAKCKEAFLLQEVLSCFKEPSNVH